MKKTTLQSLEKRVAAHEKSLAQVVPDASSGILWKDWRQAIGEYRVSEISEEIDAAGRKIRDTDRRRGAQP